MKIACHQPNFCPWFPFFYKMAMADIFIILVHVQFEKNSYQNRYKYNDKWITKPVKSGLDLIKNKEYVDGNNLLDLNLNWINAIKNTLGIKTEIRFDYETNSNSTQRLIDLITDCGGKTYITNPEAKTKYLNEDLMWTSGIDIEYCNVPKHLQIHTFEAFEKFGIDGCIKQLPKRENAEFTSVL